MENEKCPFCGCGAIYEIERNDDLIGTYPQLFCNGCKMVFETENNSPYLKDKDTFNYLREKTWRTWNTRTLHENTIQLPCKVGDEVWCLRDTRVYNKPVKGTVTEIYFRDNMDMCIVVRRLCRGRWGERIFETEQEAWEAINKTEKNNMKNSMKIKAVTDEAIIFDNGNKITFDHEQDCCEYNFADFGQIEEFAFNVEFDENLTFEMVDGSGFRFGNLPAKMFFVPCYSQQNGYYSTNIEIYYNGEKKLSFDCEEDFD